MDRSILWVGIGMFALATDAMAAQQLTNCVASDVVTCDQQGCKVERLQDEPLSMQVLLSSGKMSIRQGEGSRSGRVTIKKVGDEYAAAGVLGPIRQGNKTLVGGEDKAAVAAVLLMKDKAFSVLYRGATYSGSCD